MLWISDHLVTDFFHRYTATNFETTNSETLIKRQATGLDYLPRLLGDGDTESEIVCGEEKNNLHWADQSSQVRIKIFFNGTKSPTNEPRK
jgi:hypothetical protein